MTAGLRSPCAKRSYRPDADRRGTGSRRHPQHGMSIADKVPFLPGMIGSSSASAVLLELVHNGHAPAAIVLHEPDAILLLGLIVAREMSWRTPVAARLDRESFETFRGLVTRVGEDGVIAA
ncbi:aconitase X swivel domain-containing protein [Mesorhizobium yinganensis]|uniref:aconitase X swivel domain-containing protein n=1 Tax=Mesorhizobium yinganensis TaxID=3157707 RepID=UPI003CCDD502